MFKLYREPTLGEFFIVFADGAQGGKDKNYVQFLSKTRADYPLVFSMHGVTAEAVTMVRQALEYIYQKTKVKPVVAFERNMGGASAMQDLFNSNHDGHYTCYFMRDAEGRPTDRLGWETTSVSRPKMLGEYLAAYNAKLITIYDKETQEQHQTFIVNKNGKPEAAPNTHDDAVIACAGAWQLYQTETPPLNRRSSAKPIKRMKFHVG